MFPFCFGLFRSLQLSYLSVRGKFLKLLNITRRRLGESLESKTLYEVNKRQDSPEFGDFTYECSESVSVSELTEDKSHDFH